MSSPDMLSVPVFGQNFRVLHFCDVLPPVLNGVVQAIETLAHYQRTSGHDVTIIGPRLGSAQTGLDEATCTLRLASLPLPTRTGYRLMWPWPQLKPLEPGAVAGIAIKDIAAGRVVLHVHSVFVACFVAHCWRRQVMSDSRAASLQRIPIVLTYHTRLEYYAHYSGPIAPLFRRFVRAYVRRVLQSVDLVIAPSEQIAGELRALPLATPVQTAPSGIRCAAFSAASDAMTEHTGTPLESRQYVLCVGRLAPEKNTELLIQAWAFVRSEAVLILIGTGPARTRLQHMVQKLGLTQRIRFLGQLPTAQVPQWYAGAAAFISASISETQGLVYAEALSAGLSIIAVDSPVTREMVRGSDARLVEADAAQLARAIDTDLADAGRRTSLARSARMVVGGQFDHDRCGQRVDRAYQTLLVRRP